MFPAAQWVGPQGVEMVGTGANPSSYVHFLSQILGWRIVIAPPILCMKSLIPEFFLKPKKFPLRNVSAL